MKAIRLAVVGVGSFGRHHVKHLSCHPRVSGVTVIDRDAARARTVADAHGATVGHDLASVAADAAVVAVPTEAHAGVALTLLQRGISVFIEKPIADTVEAAEAIAAAAADHDLVVQVGHVERFSRPFRALAEAVSAPQTFVATRHNPPRPTPPTADVVLDLMIHDIDLVLALAKAPVRHVVGALQDGGESAFARIDFADGATAELSASRLAANPQRTLRVDEASLSWRADFVAQRLERWRGGAAAEVPLPPVHDNLACELDMFVASVLGERVPEVDAAAGIAALQVANTVRAAAPIPTLLSA